MGLGLMSFVLTGLLWFSGVLAVLFVLGCAIGRCIHVMGTDGDAIGSEEEE